VSSACIADTYGRSGVRGEPTRVVGVSASGWSGPRRTPARLEPGGRSAIDALEAHEAD
jgi:hypothetical protein